MTDIVTLQRAVAANRFLPIPPGESNFVGDGDFRAIGAEFLGHLVTLGGLTPEHRVLEIGCGIGRMALPLTQYLAHGAGSYDGVDIVAAGIRWCREAISPVYDNFRFHHIDFRNDVYNPDGRLDGAKAKLPFPERRFDFVFLTSVVTHLRQAETEAYAAEIGRLLRPGGRCFLSMFLMNEDSRAGLRAAKARLPFPAEGEGPEFLADPDHPGGAVAFEQDWFLRLMASHRMRLVRSPVYGHWSGRDSANYQDLCVFERDR